MVYKITDNCNNKIIDYLGGCKMPTDTKQILKEALELPAIERASLADYLLSSLDQPDERIDALWRKEVEDRIDAYHAGKMKAISLEEVLLKYKK
jgi:putative addiction module component (TIGR02574 family)